MDYCPEQISSAENNKNIDVFHNPEKSLILGVQKLSLMEVGESSGESRVETQPSVDKHESPAEVFAEDKNVARSDSDRKKKARKNKARKEQKKRRKNRRRTTPHSYLNPLKKIAVDACMEILLYAMQHDEIPYDLRQERDRMVSCFSEVLGEDFVNQKILERRDREAKERKMIQEGR